MRGSAGLAWQQQQHKYASPQQHSRQRVMQLSLATAIPSCRHPQHRSSTGSVQLHRPSEAVQAAVSTKHAAADPCLELTGVQSKAAGSLLAAMCGNALGAQVEPEKHYRLSRMFPDGLHDMRWTFDISTTPLPPGHVTGDFAVMAAVAQSVVRCKTADPLDMCDAMAACYDASAPEQWYSPYHRLMLEGLAAGSNPFLLAKHADGYLASTASRASNTATHRPARQLHGMSDFSALARVIPVAVAYRAAPLHVLREAAEAAVLLTHPTDTAADAAAVLAAAIAWCMRADPDITNPGQLLEHLLSDVASTADMRDMLGLLQDSLPSLEGLGSIDSWHEFWRSKAWNDVTGVANFITKQNLAVEAASATALALWVLLISWQHPKQAVMLAASLGGYAATTGTLVGSMAGALHGCGWVPAAWWDHLQEAERAGSEPAGQSSLHGRVQHSDKQAHAAGAAEKGGTAAGVSLAGQEGGGDLQEQEEVNEEAAGWVLQPVSKQSVVKLALQLSELECVEAAPLL